MPGWAEDSASPSPEKEPPSRGFGSRPPTADSGGGGGGGNYDVVHLSSRNARLEEKLTKALSKNRSMAKYYDQLLAKTREQHERELEDKASEFRKLQDDLSNLRGVQEQYTSERAEREVLSSEVRKRG